MNGVVSILTSPPTSPASSRAPYPLVIPENAHRLWRNHAACTCLGVGPPRDALLNDRTGRQGGFLDRSRDHHGRFLEVARWGLVTSRHVGGLDRITAPIDHADATEATARHGIGAIVRPCTSRLDAQF